MTDDLVTRLRETQKLYEQAGVDGSEGALQAGRAADRIEELEAKLTKATGSLDLIANHQAANPHEDTECQAYARVALAEIKG